MRKILALLLILSLFLTGCSILPDDTTDGLKFYYPLQSKDYSIGTPYLQFEAREQTTAETSIKNILNLYLKGPTDLTTFRMPFQYNTQVVLVSREIGVLNITLNREFANCTGLDLTIACACIAKTCLELTDASTVRIRAIDSTLDGAEFIEMSEQSLLLIDFGSQLEE